MQLVDISVHLEITGVSWFGLRHAELGILVPYPALGNESFDKLLHELFHLVNEEAVAIIVNLRKPVARFDQLNFVLKGRWLQEGSLALDSVALPALEKLVLRVLVIAAVLLVRIHFATLFFLNFVHLFRRSTVVLVFKLVSVLGLSF